MKTLYLILFSSLLLISPSLSQAQLFIGWDEQWGNPGTTTTSPADQSVDPLVTGSVTWSGTAPGAGFSGSEWATVATDAGSEDGTFGNTVAGAYTGPPFVNFPAIRTVNTTTASSVEFSMTNGTGFAYDLTLFSFDSWRSFGGSPATWDLEVLAGSDITTGAVSNGNFVIQGGNPGPVNGNNYEGFDISLLSLADRRLDPGESATFRLNIPVGSNLFLDNVAISAVPEPSVVAAFALGGIAFLVILRRRLKKA